MDQGKWSDYIVEMGGACLKATEYPVRLWRRLRDQPGYYGNPPRHETIGVCFEETEFQTRDRTWAIVPFTSNGKRVRKMNTAAWRKGRLRAGLPQVRVHDLKHTFGRRLRASGVSFEDRQDWLGHRSGRITTHYSAAEFGNLLSAASRVVGQGSRKTPALFILKKKQLAHGTLTA